jgi:hypothetical protein
MIIFQATVFILYVSFIVYRYGILPSISESWYRLPEGQNFLFTAFTWGVGIPMMFYDVSWLFFSGTALTFVGVATMFKSEHASTSEIHYIGALLGIGLPLAYFGFGCGNWIPLAAQAVATLAIVLTKTPNKIWWVEIAAFVCVLFGLINL